MEREEAHLKQLRDKDVQYAQLIAQLNSKIQQLEMTLREAHQKRASIVEARDEEIARQRASQLVENLHTMHFSIKNTLL